MSDDPFANKGRPVRADDGKAFNDPDAWGYCEFCAFVVAVADGVRLEHPRIRLGNEKETCQGSGGVPTEETPETAKPRLQISLRKDAMRCRSRAWYQRIRFQKREELRQRRKLMGIEDGE